MVLQPIPIEESTSKLLFVSFCTSPAVLSHEFLSMNERKRMISSMSKGYMVERTVCGKGTADQD
jgi:hypothetical protein